jgi:hypothetical protein
MGVKFYLLLERASIVRVCPKRVLRKVCGPEREEVTGDWRKLHTEELHDVYCSPDMTGMNNSRKMRYAGHADG